MKIVILLLIYFSRGLFAGYSKIIIQSEKNSKLWPHFLAENDACTTPDDKDGTCIRFRNCQVLFGINRKIPENAELIRQSQCGTSDDNKPLVCCPKAIVFQPRMKENNQIRTHYVKTSHSCSRWYSGILHNTEQPWWNVQGFQELFGTLRSYQTEARIGGKSEAYTR